MKKFSVLELLILIGFIVAMTQLGMLFCGSEAEASPADYAHGPIFQVSCGPGPCAVINTYTGEVWMETRLTHWRKMKAEGGPEESSTPWRD